MRKLLRKWLGVKDYDQDIRELRLGNSQIRGQIDTLEKELRECMKYIGALYDHLEIRPQRTFVEDFSRLPQEERPTMEVIKAVKLKKPASK